MNKSLIVLAVVLAFSSACYGQLGDGANIIYDPGDGSLRFQSNAELVTTVEVRSPSGWFTGDRPANHDGLFDVYNPGKSFKLDPAGYLTADMGNIGIGRSKPDFLAEFAGNVAGARAGGGNIDTLAGGVPHALVYVPEPSSTVTISIGLLGICAFRRRAS